MEWLSNYSLCKLGMSGNVFSLFSCRRLLSSFWYSRDRNNENNFLIFRIFFLIQALCLNKLHILGRLRIQSNHPSQFSRLVSLLYCLPCSLDACTYSRHQTCSCLTGTIHRWPTTNYFPKSNQLLHRLHQSSLKRSWLWLCRRNLR